LLFQQELAKFAGAGRGRRVALMGRHNGALHEDVPFPRERIDIFDSALGGEAFEIAADIRQMTDGRLMNRMLSVVNFDHRRQECATLEVGLAEPLRENVKDCQQPLTGSSAATPAFCL
jgi:hypothetical protein